jgi:hypothetical protein
MTSLNIYTEEMPPGLLESLARRERRQAQDEGRRASDHFDDDGGGPTVDWTWKHMTGIFAVLAFVFTLGANWHRLDAMTDRFDTQVKQNAEDHATFANKQTIDAHFDSLQRQIEDLKTLVRDRVGRR